MSIPLIDVRIKVTPEIHAMLEVLSASTGSEKSEIARDVLHKWAVKEIRDSMMLHAALKRKGILRDYEVASGHD